MASINIPKEQWTAFCNDFSKTYKNWLTTLTVDSPYTNRHLMVRELPFKGITAEQQESTDSIAILLQEKNDNDLNHIIGDAQEIESEDTSALGGTVYLKIKARNGEINHLYLRHPPEDLL